MVALFGKRCEIEVPIESECVIVNCVHDECSKSDLRGVQIGQCRASISRNPPNPLPLVHPIKGKAPKSVAGTKG